MAFHLRHYPINLFYDGEIWEKPFAARFERANRCAHDDDRHAAEPQHHARHAWGSIKLLALGATNSRDRILALCLLQGLLSVGVVALSDVPKYGGEKLFMPLFPFLAVLAAVGAKEVADVVGGWLTSSPSMATRRRVTVAVVFVALLTPGVVGIGRTWGGYGLSYSGELVGGLRGATARGYERTGYVSEPRPWLRSGSLRNSRQRLLAIGSGAGPRRRRFGLRAGRDLSLDLIITTVMSRETCLPSIELMDVNRAKLRHDAKRPLGSG